MEIIFELLFSVVGEFILQLLFELLVEFGLENLAEPFRRREDSSPLLAVVGYAALGAVLTFGTFAYGAAFAFGMALVRVLFTTWRVCRVSLPSASLVTRRPAAGSAGILPA